MTEPTQYMTPAQAARALHLSVRRIAQLMDSGALGHIRTPLGRLIPLAVVQNEASGRGLPIPPRMPDRYFRDGDFTQAEAWWERPEPADAAA